MNLINVFIFLQEYSLVQNPATHMEYEILNYEQEILTNSQIRQLERPQDPSLFTFKEW